ncbi:MAG: ABC transporter permease subunit [Planctomycetia bacterium]|nr:ABC transporter permease subunit [Planctomycetia bacterium]
MLNKALWRKAIGDARVLLVCMTALLFGFNWLFVYLSSLIELGPLGVFLQTLPPAFEKLSGVPFGSVATPVGRISMAYVDPVVIFATTIWAVGRGSDAVSGEIGRGTMEMLLAQPVRRISVLFTQAVTTLSGAAVMAAAALAGTCAGLATVRLHESLGWMTFLPGAINLFAVMVFLAGVSTVVSSWDNYRWRTIGIMGGFYVIELVVKVVGRLVDRFHWLLNLSFLTAFEPQALIAEAPGSWALSWQYNGVLIGLGLAGYAAAALVFCRRDLPAPL